MLLIRQIPVSDRPTPVYYEQKIIVVLLPAVMVGVID